MILEDSEKKRLQKFFSEIASKTVAWKEQSWIEECKPITPVESEEIRLKNKQERWAEIFRVEREKAKSKK